MSHDQEDRSKRGPVRIKSNALAVGTSDARIVPGSRVRVHWPRADAEDFDVVAITFGAQALLNLVVVVNIHGSLAHVLLRGLTCEVSLLAAPEANVPLPPGRVAAGKVAPRNSKSKYP